MIPKIPVNQHIKNLKQLIMGKKSDDNSRLLSEKFSSELALIEDLLIYIDTKEPIEKKIILGELGTFTQLKEFDKGYFFRSIFGVNNDFIMLLKGKIMEFEIKYIHTSMTFQEFILYLTKIFLLNEKYIYWDCLEKNNEAFPFKTFKYYIENWTAGLQMQEEEKNGDKSWLKNINVIEICKELNMKNFDFLEELKKIKDNIANSEWNNFDTKNNNLKENDYNNMIDSFFDLYNFKLDKNVKEKSSSMKEVKYKVCLPYFYKKRILNPISFVGDLNRPVPMKNYSGFIALDDCFVVYIDKSKLSPTRQLFKYIYNNKSKYIAENLFKEHFLFKNINVDYLNKFGKYMHIIKLNKDEILFKQDEPHQGVYIIMKGSIQLETYQSYRDLIYLNFLLMHSLDYCPDYISDTKKNQIEMNYNKIGKNRSVYLNGYYDYNSNLNILTKNPIFKEKSKIKENIIFCIYKKNDILGLGETVDYKIKTNIFTAKSLSNDTELIFIPRVIFKALLSSELIYNKCGSITEEKTRALGKCIDKYKNIFEKKIELFLNNKKIYQKIKLLNNSGQNFGTILNRIKSSGFNTKTNKLMTGPNYIILNKNKDNKNKFDENNKNNISYHDKSKEFEKNENNELNEDMNDAKNNEFLSPKKKLIKNYLNQNDSSSKKLQYNKTLMASTNLETSNKLLLNDFNAKIILNSQYPTINQRNNKNDEIFYLNPELKRKRGSSSMFISYDFNFNLENSKVNKPKQKRNNKKMNVRSFSAQRLEEKDIKRTILDYQNSYKEMNKFYNNISEKNRNLLPKKINLSKSNFEIDAKNNFNIQNSFKNIKIQNSKKIVINKFSSSSLFKKNVNRNIINKAKIF